MLALGRAWATRSSTAWPSTSGSSSGFSIDGPRCQPSDTDSIRPVTSNTRPVTPADSGLASQQTIGAMCLGESCSLASSGSWPMPRSSVMRVRAAGAMALTVTP